MEGFISEVLRDLHKQGVDFSKYVFVLPNRRAGLFLKRALSKINKQPILAPQVVSVEEFIQELSQLQPVSQTELLFEFYSVYQEVHENKECETFESFINWAPILLQDFNEVDRFLVDPDKLFNYLSAVKRLEGWELNAESDLPKSYPAHWELLGKYYNTLTQSSQTSIPT